MKLQLIAILLLTIGLTGFAVDTSEKTVRDDLAATASGIEEAPAPGTEKVDLTAVTPEGATGKPDSDGLYTPQNAADLPKWYVGICETIDLLLPAQAFMITKDYNDAYTGSYLLSLASTQLHSYIYSNMSGKAADIVWDAISNIDRIYADINSEGYSGKPIIKGNEYREKIIKIRNDFRNLINTAGKKSVKYAIPDTNGQG